MILSDKKYTYSICLVSKWLRDYRTSSVLLWLLLFVMLSLGYVCTNKARNGSYPRPFLVVMLWEKIGLLEKISPFLFLNMINEPGMFCVWQATMTVVDKPLNPVLFQQKEAWPERIDEILSHKTATEGVKCDAILSSCSSFQTSRRADNPRGRRLEI